MEQGEQTEIFDSYEAVSDLLARDGKIIFARYTEDYRFEFQYIDTVTMENKFFTSDIGLFDSEEVDDVLFDGQKIIYKTSNREDEIDGHRLYSICIFTGEITEIG